MRIGLMRFVVSVLTLCPAAAFAQNADLTRSAPRSEVAFEQQGQAPAQGLQNAVTETVKRFNIGAYGGITLDPEMITFGAFGNFAPIFSPAVAFRPGLYLSFGEVTTEFGIDLDVLYTIPGTRGSAWHPYVGGGPNFALSHRGFETTVDSEDSDSTTTSSNGTTTTTTETSRFDFGDTSFDAGFNFIVGAQRPGGAFFEMKATAYGVSSVKLLAGFRF